MTEENTKQDSNHIMQLIKKEEEDTYKMENN